MSSMLQPGQVLGARFAVVGPLGAGGTASVWLVVDQHRGEQVALKVVHPHLAADPGVQRRLRRELTTASTLDTDYTLVPNELVESDGWKMLVLPYHSGRTLTEHIAARGPMPIDQVVALAERMGSALQDAHLAGILHRDVSANNIMLRSGRDAVLMDFGLARQTDGTRSTGLLGTLGFAAPELFSGGRASPATDLYGLGTALFLALTGELPFQAQTAMGAMQQQLGGPPPSVSDRRSDCPPDLARTVEWLLQRDPDERPRSAGEVLDSLKGSAKAETVVGTGGAHVEPGEHAVVVSEREDDRMRRRILRVDQGKARPTVEAAFGKRMKQMWSGVLTAIGMEEADTTKRTPEDLLLRAITDEAKLGAVGLDPSPALLQETFILIDGISSSAANRIAADVRSAGFKAETQQIQRRPGLPVAWFMVAAILTGLLFRTLPALIPLVWMSVVLALIVPRIRHARQRDLAVAYHARLDVFLHRPVAGRFTDGEEQVTSSPTPRSTGERLQAHALEELQALDDAIASAGLSIPAQSDLKTAARELREQVEPLAGAVDQLEAELARPRQDLSWVEPRLRRLQTQARAGQPIDANETEKLEGLLRTDSTLESDRERLEHQLTATTSSLREVAVSAAATRQSLLLDAVSEAELEPARERLARHARAAAAARREIRS